jgi:hypothetical protein
MARCHDHGGKAIVALLIARRFHAPRHAYRHHGTGEVVVVAATGSASKMS